MQEKDSSPVTLRQPNQIGIIVRDIEKASRAYAELLGVEIPAWSMTDTADKTNIRYLGQTTEARAKLAFFNLGNITIELIEPVGDPSTWQAFLGKQGEGVHNFGFIVDSIEDDTPRFTNQGMQVEQQGDFDGGRYVYIDSVNQLGIMLEFLEYI